MIAFLSWYLASSLLGWLTFPLVFRLFPALADRGYTLTRTAGLLLWGWLFWVLASLGVLRNDIGGLLFAFILLVGLSVWAIVNRKSEIVNFLQSNRSLFITTEILFLLAFAFLAIVRASNPDATATEKPMELAFINGILRSPTLPPNDPWMSGYSISYYHFGYIMTAMLARVTGVVGSVAFNLMSALVFALAALGSYGVLYNLLAAYAGKQVDTYTGTQVETEHETREPQPASLNPHSFFILHLSSLALLAPLFLLLFSNAEGFLEVIHKWGWFWPSQQPIANSQQPIFNFWTWLDIKDLTQQPMILPGGMWERLTFWVGQSGWSGIGQWFNEQVAPDRFWWWWRASRVVQDFDLVGAPQEVIDEFPFFSFLLGDLHPHVLSLPFNMLGIGVTLNLFLGGWRGIVKFRDYRLHTTPRDFFFAALVLGGLAFLNTWDILPAAALMVGAYVLVRVRAEGWSWQRIEDAFLLGIPLALSAFLLYLPFYLGFSSQAGGLLPNLVIPTRGAQLWVMWGTLLLPILAWLLWQTRTSEVRPRLLPALAGTVGLILFLWAFSWLLGFLVRWRDPAFAAQYIASQGQADMFSLFRAALNRRFAYIGGLLTIASVTWLSLAHLLKVGKPQVESQTSDSQSSTFDLRPSTFNLLLVLIASLLILAPDFVYLRDIFSYRINTVFKFYYQAWQLWSLAAAFGTIVLLQNLRRVWGAIWRVALTFLLIVGLAYPLLALPNKTNNFHLVTLDGAAHIEREAPEDAAAIRYLQSAPLGVVAEAVGGSYSNYARISTHTGLPTVLGWPWHEVQWRGNAAPQGSREADIRTLYEVPDWEAARTIMDRYHIRYIVVGLLERTTYNVNENKFQQNLVALFQAGSTVVYGAP
jgi:YYY domain-containing protein